MSLFVAVDNIDKVFPLSGGGEICGLKRDRFTDQKRGIYLPYRSLWLRKIHPLKHDRRFRFAHGRSGDFARSKH